MIVSNQKRSEGIVTKTSERKYSNREAPKDNKGKIKSPANNGRTFRFLDTNKSSPNTPKNMRKKTMNSMRIRFWSSKVVGNK